jgi:hypothetical protein
MIEGLKLDIRADELMQRLDSRIAHHRAKADAYDSQLLKLGEIEPSLEDDDVMGALRGRESPRASLERKRHEHLERVEVLTFLREHIVNTEVYRLDEQDLRMAELLPDRFNRW